MNLRSHGSDGGLGEHVRQIGPAKSGAFLIHRWQIRFLLRAGTRQIGIMIVNPIANRACGIRGRYELDAQLLGQCLNHCQNQLIQQTRHIPCELVGRNARECLERHMHGDAIGRVGWVVHVAQAQVDRLAIGTRGMPMVGVIIQTDRVAGCQAFHLGRVEIQQIRLLIVIGLPPFRQIGHTGHIIGNDGIIKIEQILVGNGVRQLTGAAGIIGGILKNVAIPAHEFVVAEALLNVTFHQALTNQEITGLKRIDAPPLHGTILHNRQTIEQDACGGHGGAARAGPMRFCIRGAG